MGTDHSWNSFFSAVLSVMVLLSTAKGNPVVYADPLNAKQQSIVAIAAFTANGNVAKLDIAIHEGLGAGLTVSEIKEVIVQMYAYAGFPRSLNALHTFMEVLKERKSKGINDTQGKTASPYLQINPSLNLEPKIKHDWWDRQ